jgi:hypothetical protein
MMAASPAPGKRGRCYLVEREWNKMELGRIEVKHGGLSPWTGVKGGVRRSSADATSARLDKGRGAGSREEEEDRESNK